jgi:serine/threonine protein kinase
MNIINLSKNVVRIGKKIYKKYNLLINVENKQFLKEQYILRLLNKRKIKFIPKLISVKIKNNIGYLVMSYIKGSTLANILDKIYTDKSDFNKTHVLNWIVKLRKIINNIHKCNIIHRDLKPENIIINKNNDVYIIDFGNSYYGNIDKNVSGTINYMCPNSLKLFLGFKNIKCDYKTDLWSLAIIYYEIYYKHHPFIEKNNKDDYNVYQNKIINNILNFKETDINKILYTKKIININIKNLLKEYYK